MNMTPVPNAPMDMKASLVWEVKFALGAYRIAKMQVADAVEPDPYLGVLL
jgi:hypothetical protein